MKASRSSLSLSVFNLNQAQLHMGRTLTTVGNLTNTREWEPGGLPSMGLHRVGHD